MKYSAQYQTIAITAYYYLVEVKEAEIILYNCQNITIPSSSSHISGLLEYHHTQW